MFSTIFNVSILSWNPEIGCVRLARHLEDEEGSERGNNGQSDVILLYLDLCLIM